MVNEKDIERSRTISDAELLKTGAEYIIDAETKEKKLIPTPEQISAIHEKVEHLLNLGLTIEDVQKTGFDISFGLNEGMPFDFDLERERRAYVKNVGLMVENWQNHILDYYDASGRIRVREKNGQFIFGLKIPLFSQDTAKSKSCIRLQLKPVTEKQLDVVRQMRDLLASEPSSLRKEKYGVAITLRDGQKAWLNKNERGDYWVEVEGEYPIDTLLPDGLEFLEYRKSEIEIKL